MQTTANTTTPRALDMQRLAARLLALFADRDSTESEYFRLAVPGRESEYFPLLFQADAARERLNPRDRERAIIYDADGCVVTR